MFKFCFIKNKTKICFLIFCSCCCLYHIITILQQYFSGEVNKYISIGFKDALEIPWISLCFKIYQFEQFENFSKLFINETSNLNDLKKIYMKLDGKVSLSEIYQVLPKKDKLFRKISVAPKSINEKWVSPPIMVNPFFFEPYYCFVIGVDTEKPYKIAWHDTGLTEYGSTFLEIKIDRKEIKNNNEIYLFTHQHKTYLHKASLGSQKIYLKPLFKTFEFTFERLRYKLLPYPYETDCCDYSRFGFRTRTHAFDSCVQNETKKLFNRNLPYTIARVDSDAKIGYVYFSQKKSNLSVYTTLQKIRYNCSIIFSKPDCDLNYFKIPSYWFIKSSALKYLFIKMRVINGPQIEITSKEKNSLSQSIIYIASVLGIWFGFSITHNLPKILNSFIFKNFAKFKSKELKLKSTNNLFKKSFHRSRCNNRF